ncbi:MAG: lipid-A-disaccharide synthase [Holosporales bacterium]|jgi:lipid-A-disaccharide synthase|nr:lipid-A-disaccharide synthase [Holosporales bacterium]
MKRLYIIAGEASGDNLGASVLRALPGAEVSGVGGASMESLGFRSLFDINEIAVGGISEALPCIFKIMRLIKLTVEDIVSTNPGVVLTIDSPEFCFRVAKRIRAMRPEIKLVHLVAPSVWAWRPGRAKSLAKIYDHILTLFEFEPQYFTKHGLQATFVGHPAAEEFPEGDSQKKPILILMPGSREQEIKRHLPIFLEAAKNIKFLSASMQGGVDLGEKHVDIDRVVIPTLSSVEPLVRSIVGDSEIEVVSDEARKMAIYRSARSAVVASGTATLHLALSSCPMVVCYKLSYLSYAIIRPLVKVKFISLVNIILGRGVVPELIQSACNAKAIVNAISDIDEMDQMDSFRAMRQKLTPGCPQSEMIATMMMRYLV